MQHKLRYYSQTLPIYIECLLCWKPKETMNFLSTEDDEIRIYNKLEWKSFQCETRIFYLMKKITVYHFNFIGITNAIEMWICTCENVEWDFFKKGTWKKGLVYDHFHPTQVYYLLIPQTMISATKMMSDLIHIIKPCVRYML